MPESTFGLNKIQKTVDYINKVDTNNSLKNDDVSDSREFYETVFGALQSKDFVQDFLLTSNEPIIRIFARGIHEDIFENIVDTIDSAFKVLYVHLDESLLKKIKINFVLCRNESHINTDRGSKLSKGTYNKFINPLGERLSKQYGTPLNSFNFFFIRHDVLLDIDSILSPQSDESFIFKKNKKITVGDIPSFTTLGDFRLNRIRKDLEEHSHMATIVNNSLEENVKKYLSNVYDIMEEKSHTKYSLQQLMRQ